MPEVGDRAPDFTLASTRGEIRLSSLLRRGPVILAFYTEDATPLCSREVAMFRDDFDVISQLGAQVVAISTDSLASHEHFAERLEGVQFPLASDENGEASRAYGVLLDDDKRSARAVFVVGANGVVLHAEPWFQPGNSAQYEAVFLALSFGE
jgi:peroxiredoxin Q/BCP